MIGNTVSIGKYGENLAAEYLIQNGFSIVCRNYRSGHNEIDIIAENATHILFVEVKTRSYFSADNTGRFGRPGRAVTYQKRRHTVDAALVYLHNNKPVNKLPRMDVIEIYLKAEYSETPRVLKLNWIKCAYGRKG